MSFRVSAATHYSTAAEASTKVDAGTSPRIMEDKPFAATTARIAKEREARETGPSGWDRLFGNDPGRAPELENPFIVELGFGQRAIHEVADLGTHRPYLSARAEIREASANEKRAEAEAYLLHSKLCEARALELPEGPERDDLLKEASANAKLAAFSMKDAANEYREASKAWGKSSKAPGDEASQRAGQCDLWAAVCEQMAAEQSARGKALEA